MVTRQDDSQFTSFVNWVVTATFYWEERTLYQVDRGGWSLSLQDMPEIRLFGEAYRNMFRDALDRLGPNSGYAEFYDKNVASILPRGGRNTINKVSTQGPQIYIPSGFSLTS